MKRRNLISGLAAAAVPASAETSFAAQWKDSFLKHWKVTRDYTIEFLDDFPAEHYSFKPVDVQRSFGEQMVHLGRANVAYMNSFGLLAPPAAPDENAAPDAVRKYVIASFDYVTEVLNKASEADLMRTDLKLGRLKVHSGTDLCMRAYMHTAHHRGQLVVYLRLKGITPPTWAFEPTAA
jgi:uncharacterized damage-inducible protein DinB